MRLFVYSEVRLFGQSLGASMRREGDVEEVVVEHDAHGIEEKVLGSGADVVVCDVSSEAELQVLDHLANHPEMPPIVAVAVSATAHHVMACAEAGVYHMVHRDATLNELRGAVVRALTGEVVCRPEVTRLLFDEIRDRRLASGGPGGVDSVVSLTPRESDVLHLVAAGKSNKQIARELHLSVSTVKKHVHSLFQKLQIERRSQARAVLERHPLILGRTAFRSNRRTARTESASTR